jgi:pyruvate dehydrogenase complex dehydrogenase (E1) component
MMAIFQARFTRYLENRGLVAPSDQKVWAFLGDGEMDEPESMGALTMPVREKLDNLIFVINCNLQRLDGPVRGNGKIIQELEAFFRGAGWNVIKVVWGREWDPLLAADTDGALVNLMNSTPDGDYQTYKANDGAYVREHFFGRDAVTCEQWNLLHPGDTPRVPYVTSVLADADGPVVAVSDWMRAVPDLVSRWIPGDYTSLGTDGFGMSDTRHALRRHFHVDAESIVVATLRLLAVRGEVPASAAADAATKYAISDVSAAPVGETGGDS